MNKSLLSLAFLNFNFREVIWIFDCITLTVLYICVPTATMSFYHVFALKVELVTTHIFPFFCCWMAIQNLLQSCRVYWFFHQYTTSMCTKAINDIVPVGT